MPEQIQTLTQELPGSSAPDPIDSIAAERYNAFPARIAIQEELAPASEVVAPVGEPEETLDTNPSEPTTEYSLGHETIRELIRSAEEPLDRATAQYNSVYASFCRAYNPKGRSHNSEKQYVLEARFADRIDQLKAEIDKEAGDNDIWRRVVGFEFVTMHELLMDGGLDRLYRQYVKQMRATGVQMRYDRAAELETKVELCANFLQRLRERDREQPLSEAGLAATIGLEAEYTNEGPITFLDKVQARHEHPFWSDPIWKRLVGGRIGRLHIALDKRGSYQRLNLELIKSEPVRRHAVSTSGAGVYKWEMRGTTEIAMNYSASLRAQLRALFSFLKTTEVGSSELGLHESLGVTLTPEHTEVMDILPILCATGYMPQFVPKERIPKWSKYGERRVYYPFHTARINAAEIRSLPGLLPDLPQRTAKLVRMSTFIYLAGAGVKAVQADPSSRNPGQAQLSSAWGELMSGWKQLIDEYGIHFPSNEERYSSASSQDCEYNTFLLRVMQACGNTNPSRPTPTSFSYRARKLVIAYQGKARSLLIPNLQATESPPPELSA